LENISKKDKGNMKRLLLFIILFSSFLLLCPGIKAQWEGAQIQRLTFDTLPNKVVGLYIDENEKLYLFYQEGVRDTITGFVYNYRILYKTKEKGNTWSLPVEINTPTYIFGANRKGGLWMDTKTGIIHILYWTYSFYDTLYYSNNTYTNWELVKIDSLNRAQSEIYSQVSMAFDQLGNAHILWNDIWRSAGSYWYKVIYANNSSGEWVKHQVSPVIELGGIGPQPSLFDIQENGSAHIVYQGETYSDTTYVVFYTRNETLNDTNWITDTLPQPSRTLWYYNVGAIKVDVNDRVHLITQGCIAQDCVWPGLSRTFYYSKQAEDSIWQGPELIPDTATFGSITYVTHLLVNKLGVPFVQYGINPDRAFLTDRKTGSWKEPYQIVDTTHTYFVGDFSFVWDSDGKGHGAFAGSLSDFMAQADSQEIYYYGPPLSSVDDTSEDHRNFSFELSQNYPNPFNSTTIIKYSLNSVQPIHTTLRLYNILGEEVRELVNTRQGKGNYRVSWDGKDKAGKEVSSGIYFYQLRADNCTETKRVLLIK
jgi:hypothetical protein